jgi:uncharacterized peroxidase-related enzyme
MNDFPLHTKETAPANSKALIVDATKAYGFLPNLLATMAESPTILEGYMTLSDIFDRSNLSPTERQIVLMTNNRLNGCTYCMAAHTSISQAANVPAEVITALRDGAPLNDPKLEALRRFAAMINEDRGWIDQDDLDELYDAGYTQATVFEVIVGTALKVMSNYTNHIVKTPLDDAFQANAWENQTTSA